MFATRHRLDHRGRCTLREVTPECVVDEDCASNRYCNLDSKTCEDPCEIKKCGVNALCNATNHQGICQCIHGYVGDPDIFCSEYLFDKPRLDRLLSMSPFRLVTSSHPHPLK